MNIRVPIYTCYTLILSCMLIASELVAQRAIEWTELPPLPGGRGWAGMYAGVSREALICFGGANFPEKYPWEGGKKKWYDAIYILEKGKGWVKSDEKLPVPSGYGAAVSYENRIILIGGSNEKGHLDQVVGYEWDGKKLVKWTYPSLPVPLANMAGALVGDVIVLAGGINQPAGPAQKTCLALDLKNPAQGWMELESWPGSARQFPVCTVYRGQFYLFSGETVGLNSKGDSYRLILSDGYRLRLDKKNDKWVASWTTLGPMPRGAAAAGTILPVLNNDRFLFWGGVDAVTSAYKSQATHPGISQNLLFYFPESDSWEFIGYQTKLLSRVTLPVVFWNDGWVYVNGEIKPGIRTPSVIRIN